MITTAVIWMNTVVRKEMVVTLHDRGRIKKKQPLFTRIINSMKYKKKSSGKAVLI